MRFKKCLAVFSLMMIMCLSVLPSFASAEAETDVLLGKKPYLDFDFTRVSTDPASMNVTDADKVSEYSLNASTLYYDLGKNYSISKVSLEARTSTANYNPLILGFYDADKKRIYVSSQKEFVFPYYGYNNAPFVPMEKEYDYNNVRYVTVGGSVRVRYVKLFGESYIPSISNVNSVAGINDVSFTWDIPDDLNYEGVKVYQDGKLISTLNKLAKSYKFGDLDSNKNYLFKFVSLYMDGSDVKEVPKYIEKSISTSIDPKTIPPEPVSSLTAESTDKTVKLKWKRPKDNDLAGFKVLQDGKKIVEIGLEEEFTVKNLKSLTDYKFDVIAFDKDKNDSSPVSLSVKTLEEKDDVPPHVPSNVDAKPSNGALIASWDKVSDKDLAGYNVYVDGKKINGNLITSTTFVIKNLENSKKYKIQVQAVDRSGNASDLSLAAFGIPDVNTIPVIENDYSVKDVSEGVGTMFSGLWLALAFAVSIPLAFYVIYKLKQTILS
ncbi:TPA: fibronectin type III domain-containing protein [Bacillus mobilis]